MKMLMSVIASLAIFPVFSQELASEDDSLKNYTGSPVEVYTKDYMRMYNDAKRKIVRVYPYALHAADMLDMINDNAAAIEKRRKQNKYYKESYESLKDEFKYAFFELYTSEGIMLMKLVHRETGMTVYDIAEKYRGKGQAEMFDVMGKLWGQDIEVTYDPEGEDRIAEHVIRDIQSGLVPFNPDPLILNKEQYKVAQAEDRERAEQNKERRKEQKKQLKEKNKNLKKQEKGRE